MKNISITKDGDMFTVYIGTIHVPFPSGTSFRLREKDAVLLFVKEWLDEEAEDEV